MPTIASTVRVIVAVMRIGCDVPHLLEVQQVAARRFVVGHARRLPHSGPARSVAESVSPAAAGAAIRAAPAGSRHSGSGCAIVSSMGRSTR